jgi:hypothetical protein
MALMCGSYAAAEDAVQEALARAWERSERGQYIGSIPGWVTTVARNLLRDRFRRAMAEARARRRLAVGPDGAAEMVQVDGVRYEARIVTSAGTPEETALSPQVLPECETPFTGCKAFGAPDVGGDGRAEVAIAIAPGGPATFYSLYFAGEAHRPGAWGLTRYTVDPPGDPWHGEYGFPPGPAVLIAYGSVTHQHWVSCREEEGLHYLVASTALRSAEDPAVYDVHSTVFGVAGASLEVVGSEQQRVPEDRLEPLDHLCGSPLFVRD